MDIKVIMCEGVGWIHLARDRVYWCYFVSMVMNFQISESRGLIELISRCIPAGSEEREEKSPSG
jgi:hypothetical protein